MVLFRFFNKNGCMIRNIGASGDLPDEVASIEIEGPFDSNKSSYKVLKTMLKSSPRRIESISCTELSADSPEFLSFLVLISSKTISLELTECVLSANAASCLMGALLTHDGIRCLSYAFHQRSEMSTTPAKILLEGVACSPCLESFDFLVSTGFRDEHEVGRCWVQALQRNKNLKNISLSTQGFSEYDTFHNVAKASILSPNVKSVCLCDCERDLRIDMLRDLLCRKDCTLEKLHLEGLEILVGEDWWDGTIIQNVSVKSLKVVVSHMDNNLSNLISLFTSLEELDLSFNSITKLSFLNPLLEEGSQLKSLDVSANRIGKEEMKHFIEKLRNIRGLKHLDIGSIDSDSVKTELIDALRHNTDIERVRDLTVLPLHLNRGGRRVFESSQEFPKNLLPRVLKRASEISYYESNDAWGHPRNKKARVDVVYWMMQRIVPQL